LRQTSSLLSIEVITLSFMKFLSLSAATIALLLAACQSVEQKAPPVSQLNAANPERCELGRSLYTTVCADCHGVKPVRARTITEWRGEILPRMAQRARLSPELESTVLAYIQAVIESPPPAKP
jgi:hypothetical protein